MAEIEEIRKQFAHLQKTVTAQTARLGEQAALLDQALPKVTKGDDVRVHVLSQRPGNGQRALNHLLTLGHTSPSSV